MEKTLEQLAVEMQREYQRQWRKANPDKVRKNTNDYWMRKAAQKLKEQEDALKEQVKQ